ncbi:YheC/YheD family endospore coat-associated protein [Natronincola ferrireducens]|nr:YheC/YheD family protein [Natronincola ferrireducens]
MVNKWIKFSRIDKETKIIYLPIKIAEKTKDEIDIHYGLKKLKVNCIFDNELKNTGEFNNPFIIKCDKTILDALMILDTLTYQLLIKEDGIHIGPVIGFMMGEQHYYYHNRFLQDLKDAMRIYEEVGGLFIAFKTSGINWNKGYLYGLYYEFKEKRWKYSKLPFPSVIFRRTLHREDKDIEKLKKMTKGKMFNTFKLDKFQVYEKLKMNISFAKYLPPTEKLKSIQIFYNFIKKNQKIILKPNGLSRGRGICIIEAIDKDLFKIYDYRDEQKKKVYRIKDTEILKFLINNKFVMRDYLIQPYLELGNIDGNVFDIRIMMQKDAEAKWQCSGIECRVAGDGNQLTNISRGGKALTIEDTVNRAYRGKLNPEQVEKDIIAISKEFCNIMDGNNGLFAEYGLDLAMDVHGGYWFIEGNFRPAFKGFKLIDYETYYEICYTTVRYAVLLAGFKNRREER